MYLPKIFNFTKYSFKKFILLLLIIIVFFSMVIFGVNHYNKSSNSSSFIKVGNIDISPNLFLAEYNLIIQQNAYLLNQNPYMISNILQGMISRYVSVLMFVNEANNLHIGASDELVYKIISNSPFFQNNGNFNKEAFQQTVSKIYGSESNYINTLKNDLKQTQLTGILVNSFYIPKKINDLYIKSLNQTRNIEYVIFSKNNVKNIPSPTNSDLLSLRDKNKDLFTIPEFRKLKVLEVNTADYLKNITVSNKEIQDYYEKNKKTFLTEETRDISQILFTDVKEAEDFYKKVKNKNSLNEFKNKVTTLKEVNKSSLPTELADIIFKSKVNVINAPIKSDIGYHLVLVNKINSPEPQPLEKVKSTIKTEVLSNKYATLYEDLKTKLTNNVVNKKSLEEINKDFNSNIFVINKVNKFGFDEKNNILSGPVQNSDLLKAAFDLPLNQISDVIVINNKFYLVQPINIIKEHIQTLEESKSDLIKLWKYNKSTGIIKTQAENFIEYFNVNGKINPKGVQVNQLTVSRNKQGANGPFNAAALEQIFLAKTNTPIEGVLDNGDIYVVITKQISNKNKVNKDSNNNEQIKEYIINNFKEDLLTQIFAQLSSIYKVNINQKSLQDIIGDKK